MRIAVACEGRELSSKVDPRFGRARFVLIHDTEKGSWDVLDNRGVSELAGGAGVKAAEAVINSKVDFVVSQNFGPKALDLFKAADVKAAVCSDGSAAEAVKSVGRGQLEFV